MDHSNFEADLTNDERYLRSLYVHYKGPRMEDYARDCGYILPAILFASFALYRDDATLLWIAFLWLFGCYQWRFASYRWTKVFGELIKKYEARIEQLEARS